MNILFALGILLAPSQQLDLSVGPKVLEDSAHMFVTPGYHLHWHTLQIGLQAPARLQLATSKLRVSDTDNLSDYGRLLRYLHIGDQLKMGSLSNLSDHEQLVFSHYFNQIDDDHHRTAVTWQYVTPDWNATLLLDQVLGPPVVGGAGTISLMPRLRPHTSAAIDTARPRLDIDVDGDTELFSAMGASLMYDVIKQSRLSFRAYTSLGQTHTNGTGLHFGLNGEWHHLWGWKLRVKSEGLLFTEGYDWAPFDLLYLVRRERSTAQNDGAERDGFGGRLMVTMSRSNLRLGAETSAAIGSPQQINTLWLEIPAKPFHFFGMVHAGRHTNKRHPFNPANISAALSAQLHLSKTWMFETTLTHVQRMDVNSYRGFLEGGLFMNWRTSFR